MAWSGKHSINSLAADPAAASHRGTSPRRLPDRSLSESRRTAFLWRRLSSHNLRSPALASQKPSPSRSLPDPATATRHCPASNREKTLQCLLVREKPSFHATDHQEGIVIPDIWRTDPAVACHQMSPFLCPIRNQILTIHQQERKLVRHLRANGGLIGVNTLHDKIF